MDRDPSRFATPADQLAKACAKCTCLEPRFDVVTLLGQRHSEFCCACGLPVADGFRGGRDVWAKAYERALNRVDVTLPPGTDLERVPKDVAGKATADAQARASADRTCHGTLSPAYAHAPGPLDAYAIGQAPGERWPHPMGEFDEGLIPKPWRR
jgi:hypothetical protein